MALTIKHSFSPNNINYIDLSQIDAENEFLFFLIHKRDSIQDTDYIANPFFMNLKVSRTTIDNLRWQFSGD